MSNLNRHPVRRTAAGVLAGALALSGAVAAATPASAAPGFQLDRIAGADRYDTSAQIAAAFDAAANVTEVIVASGENGRAADALGASFLAGVRNAPVLLTPQAGLATTTRTALTTLRANGATRVTIVGGPAAVSAAVQAEITALGFTVTRLGGADRFQTAELVVAAGEGASASNVGIVASGISTVDALAAGPLAFKGKHPVFLTRAGAIPASTIAAMRAAGVTSVYIVGGEAVVSANVRTQLTAAGITVVDRLAGQTRSGTSVAIANAIIGNTFGFVNNTFNLASGARDGVDALSGAALSGLQSRPLLVTDTDTNAGAVTAFATARSATLNTAGLIFGGPAAISTTVETAIETAGRGNIVTATSRPELVSAAVTGTVATTAATPSNPAGTTVVFTFDEAVGTVTTGATGAFKAYTSGGAAVTGGTVVSSTGSTVTVRFNDATTADQAAAITVVTVEAGAVTDLQGQIGTEGDASVGTSSTGGTTALPAGVTDAPDLVSVGNFRQAAAAGQTAVDFTFDQAATVLTVGGFALITPDGVELRGTGPATADATVGGGTVAGGNGTTTITVIFTNPDGPDDNATPGQATDPLVTTAAVARGTVDAGTVRSGAATATAPANVPNALQAADVSAAGNTVEPDLVSVELRAATTADPVERALFTFDQVVAPATGVNANPPVPGSFSLYDADGNPVAGVANAVVNSSNRAQVLVDFPTGTLVDAVGGSVIDGAVTSPADATTTPATPTRANEQDEVGVANTAQTDARTAGRTSAPDLTAVTISRAPADIFGNAGDFQATYVYDEDIAPLAVNRHFLYLANGQRLIGQTVSGVARTEDNDNSVTVTGFIVDTNNNGVVDAGEATAATSTQIGNAVLGTVDDAAVANSTSGIGINPGAERNPEGAELTTGGTGTVSS